MTKDEVAAALDEIGTLLAIKGESSFRTNAYHNAARALTQLDGDFKELVENGRLAEVRGIGDSTAEKIMTLVETGELPQLTKLRNEIPLGVREMLRLPGLGPKKVKALFEDLKVDSLEALKVACDAGQVAKMKGFGQKTQDNILEGLRFVNEVGKRVRIDQGMAVAHTLMQRIRKLPGVQRSEVCGSIRRRRETVKDIDIVVSSDDAKPIMDAFVAFPEVMQITGHGDTKSSIVAAMHIGTDKIVLNADLRVVTDDVFPFTQLYFTGSKEHGIRLRQRAIDRGWSLNEYALSGSKTAPKCKDEADIYKALGLHYVPPEMREDTGEIELAEKHPLPKLVELDDIRGVFHNHTTYSDGSASLEQMALAAKALGFEFFGVGDHSQSLKVANGMSIARVRQQHQEIDAVNEHLTGIRIFKGIECDILEDGSLDYPDEVLATFEYVVVSVHTLFNMSSEDMTARVCKALSHPATTMLGHATGRLLLKREGYKIDLDEVLKCAAKHGKMIEINAHPVRLDLDWKYVKKAKAMGIPIVINPDAHSEGELALYQFGVDVARRGWLEKADVFNTRSAAEVAKEFSRRRNLGRPDWAAENS